MHLEGITVVYLHMGNQVIFSVLLITHDLVRTSFNQWGIRGWVEATPRGVGDKAYVVLKRNEKPMHFLKITEWINAAKFDQRVAHPQTVHNELIRDERFILVGRGTYALKEWGYQAGTVGDVLERIIKARPHTLSKEVLIEEVLKERIVKRNTILLALQNRKRFERDAQGFYGIINVAEPDANNMAVEKQTQIINNDATVKQTPPSEDSLSGNA